MTYRIHSLEHSITIDIHVHGSSRLNASVNHPVPRIGETEIFFLEADLSIADSQCNVRQLVRGRIGGEDVALVGAIVLRSWDGFVDCFYESVVDEAESSAGVHDGSVVAASNSLAVDGGTCRWDLPESSAAVNIGVVGFGGAGCLQGILIDEAECVETLIMMSV